MIMIEYKLQIQAMPKQFKNGSVYMVTYKLYAINQQMKDQKRSMVEKYHTSRVTLDSGQWNQAANLEMIAHMQKWWVVELFLYYNKRTTLLNDIQNIKFKKLQYLRVDGNNITSIENIPRISMPALQKLHLSGNKIRLVRELRKGSWEKLAKLALSDNCIVDAHVLSGMAAFPLGWVVVDDISVPVQMLDLRWMIKMEPALVHSINLHQSRPSMQPNIQSVLKMKWRSVVHWIK